VGAANTVRSSIGALHRGHANPSFANTRHKSSAHGIHLEHDERDGVFTNNRMDGFSRRFCTTT
jgi:hypothetical protein